MRRYLRKKKGTLRSYYSCLIGWVVHVFWNSLSCHDSFVELSIFNWKALCSRKWTKCTGRASAGTDKLLVSEGRYFLFPASFFVVSPFSEVLASYMLQNEWKPAIVLDLNLKSKVINSSALGLWSCCWGNPCLCADATVKLYANTRVTHLAEGGLKIHEECGNLDEAKL